MQPRSLEDILITQHMRFEVFMAVKMRILASWVTILKCYKCLCNLSQYINFLRLEDCSPEEHTRFGCLVPLVRYLRNYCTLHTWGPSPSDTGRRAILGNEVRKRMVTNSRTHNKQEDFY